MMRELLSVICEDVILQTFEPGNGVLLKESSIDSKVHTLEVDYVPDDAIVFTLDYKDCQNSVLFQQLSHYVNKKIDGINKSCDLVIAWPSDNDINVLFFDLKSDRVKVDEFLFQLNNSALFFIYMIMLLEERFSIYPKHINVYKAIGSTRVSPYTKIRDDSDSGLPSMPFKQVPLKPDFYGKARVNFARLINFPCKVFTYNSIKDLLY